MCFFRRKRANINEPPPPYKLDNTNKRNYHGPINNNPKKIIRITKKDPQNEYSMVYYIDQSHLPINMRINGLDPIPVIVINNEMDSYFIEQQRLLKNRYTEDVLRLESQKVYSNIIRYS